MFSFSPRSAMYDSTPVENMFINEYMPRADGAFVKVYLYGLMRCYHPEENASIEAIAKSLGMRKEEVENAFEYWDRWGLVRRVSDTRHEYQYINILSRTTNEELELDSYQQFNSQLQALFGAKRLLRPKDFKIAHEWEEQLQLPGEVILRLVEIGIDVRGNGFGFERLNDEAAFLARNGARCAADVDELMIVARAKKLGIQRVFDRLGLKSQPSQDDARMFLGWIENQNYKLEAVLEACRETTKGRPTMAYLDGILRRMQTKTDDGARGKKDIERVLNREKLSRGGASEVLRAMGIDSSPSESWTQWYEAQLERGFEHAALVEVASKYSRAARKVERFDEILVYFAGLGIFTRDAVEAFYVQQKRQEAKGGSGGSVGEAKPSKRSSKEVAEHRYNQRDYSDEELNNMFLDRFIEDSGG